MMTTINVSLPLSFYSQVKTAIDLSGFASMSEAIRYALRKVFIGEELTENGFTKDVEREILKTSSEKPALTYKKGDDYDTFMEKMLQTGAKLNAAGN